MCDYIEFKKPTSVSFTPMMPVLTILESTELQEYHLMLKKKKVLDDSDPTALSVDGGSVCTAERKCIYFSQRMWSRY